MLFRSTNSKARTLGEAATANVYIPLRDHIEDLSKDMAGITLVVRGRGNAAGLTTALLSQIRAIDPALAIFDVKTIETHLERALFLPRLSALIFGMCGAVALAISTIGLYGVISFTVARRTKEIGIRMALGAEKGRVVGMIVGNGLVLSGIGMVIGVAAALALSRLAASLLYGVSTTDGVTFVGVPALLAMVAMIAAWIPARRAAGRNPVEVLRHD